MKKCTATIKLNDTIPIDIWLSPDHEDPSMWETLLLEGIIKKLEKKEKDYIELYGHHVRTPRIACLIAHGGEEKNCWVYFDGKQRRFIQSWIDAHDRTYGCLVISACNPESITPLSSHSLLVIPDRTFSPVTIELTSFSIIHPTLGDLDYTIDYHLKELKKQN